MFAWIVAGIFGVVGGGICLLTPRWYVGPLLVLGSVIIVVIKVSS